MKYLFLLLSLACFSGTATAAFAAAPAVAQNEAVLPAGVSGADLERTAVEAKLGRKLKFKERLALSVARGKMKRAERRAKRKANGGAPVDGFAIASLVCGVLGLFLFLPAIPGLVLGIVSLGRFRRDPQYRTGKGMAIAGVVLGGLVTLLLVLLVALFVLSSGAG